MEQLLYEVKRVVVGQDHFLERVMVAVLAQGHLLVEGVPGLAKTLTVKTLAATLRGTFKRIPVHPRPGARGPGGHAHVQSAHRRVLDRARTGVHPLAVGRRDQNRRARQGPKRTGLEVMQERQVTIAGETHRVPQPFLVMATQNPIETEGTYPLPEAQVDRFMMKVLVDYPSEEEEFVIAQRATGPAATVSAVASMGQLAELQQACRQVYVDPALMQHAVRLVSATRRPERYGLADLAKYLTFGASPRAHDRPDRRRTRAGVHARTPLRAAPRTSRRWWGDVLRHRLVLSYDALAEGLSADDLVRRVQQKIPPPEPNAPGAG